LNLPERKTKMNAIAAQKAEGTEVQYSLAKILGIWVAATLPMAILGWVVFPLMAPDFESDPLGSSVTRVVLLTLGMIWLFVLSMILVRQEEGDLRWATLKRRLRLNTPRDPKTGEERRKLWLWVVLAILGIALVDVMLASTIDRLWVSMFPFLAEPPGYNFSAVFESQAIQESLVGAWWFFALFLVFSVFNTFLGEEFLFRGVLLPNMEGVFGKWSWVANGVLFAFYHLHQPWSILTTFVGGVLFYSLPVWRFRSTWMSIIVHSAQSVFFAFLILGVVLGLA
jgi:membrane protease YdiL (CAAX protease family)